MGSGDNDCNDDGHGDGDGDSGDDDRAESTMLSAGGGEYHTLSAVFETISPPKIIALINI